MKRGVDKSKVQQVRPPGSQALVPSCALSAHPGCGTWWHALA